MVDIPRTGEQARRTSALIATLFAASCGFESDREQDAGPGDAPTSGSDRDADLVNYEVTASYLDWDSTAAAPCPIAGATWTARYDHARTATTDATGAFAIRLASYLSELDVEQPTSSSTCTVSPGTYEIPASAIVPAVIHYAGGEVVMRSLTAARAATFYAAIGSPFDAARGQLYIHVDGPSRAASISSAHDPAQAFDGSAWAAGATGVDVYFPNIDLTTSNMTTVAVADGALGTGSVVLTPGAITYMTVITQ